MKEHTTLKTPTALAACSVIAVDLAKRVFQVAGEDALGKVIYEERIKSRQAFAAFLRGLPAGLKPCSLRTVAATPRKPCPVMRPL